MIDYETKEKMTTHYALRLHSLPTHCSLLSTHYVLTTCYCLLTAHFLLVAQYLRITAQ